MIEFPLLDELLRAVAASPPAVALRGSRYAYPVVNAVHIVGFATLFGAILALDLRILGLGRTIPFPPLATFLRKVAAGGLAVAALTGMALFSVQPVDYAANRAFLLKIALVAAGTLHAVFVHRRASWASAMGSLALVTPRLKVSALVSVVVWLFAIFAGRFIGFE